MYSDPKETHPISMFRNSTKITAFTLATLTFAALTPLDAAAADDGETGYTYRAKVALTNHLGYDAPRESSSLHPKASWEVSPPDQASHDFPASWETYSHSSKWGLLIDASSSVEYRLTDDVSARFDTILDTTRTRGQCAIYYKANRVTAPASESNWNGYMCTMKRASGSDTHPSFEASMAVSTAMKVKNESGSALTYRGGGGDLIKQASLPKTLKNGSTTGPLATSPNPSGYANTLYWFEADKSVKWWIEKNPQAPHGYTYRCAFVDPGGNEIPRGYPGYSCSIGWDTSLPVLTMSVSKEK